MAEKKLTQKDMYIQIIDALNDYKVDGREQMIEFLNGRIEKLEKKATSNTAKKDEINEQCFDILVDVMADGKQMKAGEVLAQCNTLDQDLQDILKNGAPLLSIQRISSLLNKMVAAGRMRKVLDKKATYFVLI